MPDQRPVYREFSDPADIDPEGRYLLRRHRSWIRPEGAGYTDRLREAGAYHGRAAVEYVRVTHGDDSPVTAVPLEDAVRVLEAERTAINTTLERWSAP